MYIAEIIKLLKVSKYIARKIEMNMCINFSECSTREFNLEARWVYDMILDGTIQ